MKTGIELIADEREKHLLKQGRALRYDVQYNKHGQLVDGAIYALTLNNDYYPEGWNNATYQEIKKSDFIGCLAIAGALIAAEIDRLHAVQQNKKSLE